MAKLKPVPSSSPVSAEPDKEVWRKIPLKVTKGYRVPSHGRAKSLNRVVWRYDGTYQTFVGRILKHGINRHGYHAVTCGKQYSLHVLVALAFIGPKPGPKYEVNHKDGNKDNNRADNLEWVTKKRNMEHASQMGLASGGSMPGSSHPCSKLTEEQVIDVRNDPQKGAVVARELKVSKTLVSMIRRRRIWTHV